MALTTISPHDAQELIARGAKLIDIRDADAYLSENIHEADLAKLRREQIIFHCQAGKRTSNNADKLAAIAAPAEIFLLEDGIDGWKRAGLPVAVNKSQPLPLMRQVQIAAGGLILIGVVLGYTVNSGFFLLSGFVGAGLLFAGISGFCGMARLLDKMPWNQRA